MSDRFQPGEPPEIWVEVFGATHVGRVREDNQDDFSVCDLEQGHSSLRPEHRRYPLRPGGALFLVADGVGGMAGGSTASRLAIETLVKWCLASKPAGASPVPGPRQVELLQAAVAEAHEQIRRAAARNAQMAKMSTTLTAALLAGPELFIAHVGDSRAYLCRGQQIEQLTRDHTLVQRLLELGEITLEDAARRTDRNLLTRTLGFDEQVSPDMLQVGLCRGDALVLCTDGLYTYVEPLEIRDLVAAEPDLARLCHELIHRANERGGADNSTIVAVRLTGEGLPTAPENPAIQVNWLSEKSHFEAP